MINDKNRAAMAAHLCELAAAAFRSGDINLGHPLCEEAEKVAVFARPERVYRAALAAWGLSPEGVDAAVAAIERGDRRHGDARPRNARGDTVTPAQCAEDVLVDIVIANVDVLARMCRSAAPRAAIVLEACALKLREEYPNGGESGADA